MLIHHDLARTWAADTRLRGEALRVTWFLQACGEVAGRHAAPISASPEGTQPAPFLKPFLDWTRAVEAHADYEELDRVDFLHFIAGLLLRNLLSVRPVQPEVAASFVLTLLQALRLHEGAPGLALDDDAVRVDAWWSGLNENMAQDPDAAIAYLDELCGLEPQWQYAALANSRPAMRQARARLNAQRPAPVALVRSR